MFGKFEEAYLKVLKECDETSDAPVTECDKAPVNECGDGEQVTTEAADENKVKVVSFRTADPALIDALNSGFEEVVFFVKSVDDDGEETIEEVKFGSDSFDEFSIEDAPADPVEDGDDEFNEGIAGAAGGAIAGGLVGGPLGAVAGGLLGSEL